MAAESSSPGRVAALPATADSIAAAAAIATAFTEPLAQELAEGTAEGVEGLQLARPETTEATALPATAQQRALSGSQEGRSRGAERADAPRSGGVCDGDEAEQRV